MTSTRARRIALVVAAAVFFAWQNLMMLRWLRAFDGPGAGLRHAWHALHDDRLVLLVFLDAGIFSLCALAWMWRDLRRRVPGRRVRGAWFAATLLVGSPVLLLYLARRDALDAPED